MLFKFKKLFTFNIKVSAYNKDGWNTRKANTAAKVKEDRKKSKREKDF